MKRKTHPSFSCQQTGTTCPYCGASVEGKDECNVLFGEVLGREYGNLEYGAVHLLSVDCYALQHPEIHGPRSNAFHLLRLSFILHHGSSPAIGFQERRLGAIVKRKYRDFPDLKAPDDRGSITVAYIADTTDSQEHSRRVMQWAQAVWNAYKAHHQWVAETIQASKD